MTDPSPFHVRPKTLAVAGEEALRTWGQVGAYVLDVEQRSLWKASASSFTEWTNAFAQRRGSTPALIWRFKSAGKFYRERLVARAAMGESLPDLANLPPQVSAESLELLSKLYRAAPQSVLEELEPRVLRGEATRQELRSIWRTYRPLLEGRTARGKGVDAPTFEGKSDVQRLNRAEADALLGLHRFGGAWAGYPKPHLYEVMPMTDLIRVSEKHRISIDVLVLIQATASSPLEVHGIQITGQFTLGLELSPAIAELPRCVDYAWLAFPDATGLATNLPLPPCIGLLTANSTQVAVLRPATAATRTLGPSEQLTRELLRRSLRA